MARKLVEIIEPDIPLLLWIGVTLLFIRFAGTELLYAPMVLPAAFSLFVRDRPLGRRFKAAVIGTLVALMPFLEPLTLYQLHEMTVTGISVAYPIFIFIGMFGAFWIPRKILLPAFKG